MRKLLNVGMIVGAKIVIVALFALAILPVPAVRAAGGCGCMDVALVVDDTGSMGGAIASVKAGLPQIIAAAQAASCGDLRMGLVTFPNDNVVVNQPFTTDFTAIQNAIQALVAGGGGPEPESSDASLQYVVTGATALDTNCSVVVSNGPFGAFRSGCVKIAVLVTDAHPGGCHNTFTPGVDDVDAHNVALAAANAGILVAAIYVPTSGEVADIKAIMQDYATTSGGEFVETASDGTGTGEGILNIIGTCGGLGSQQCITRPAQFWFEHAFATGANTNCPNSCADLLDAIKINGAIVDLGFVRLPTAYRDSGSVLTDGTNALIEALGFYWKSAGQTGENGGTQNQKLPVSTLCKQRKQLAVELIAATANVRLLGTQPSNCTYVVNGGTTTSFPADLLAQARQVAGGVDPVACQTMTLLLRKFNNRGATNNFVGNLAECSPVAAKMLRSISRDLTTQISCPGVNNSCDSAEAVVFSTSSNPFAPASFSRTVSLLGFTSSFTNLVATCAPAAGATPGPVWKITPDVGMTNRQFTVDTFGSNFATLLQVYSGTCNNLVPVVCNTNMPPFLQSQVQFTTDGTNVFYIVPESVGGAQGKLKIRVTSP